MEISPSFQNVYLLCSQDLRTATLKAARAEIPKGQVRKVQMAQLPAHEGMIVRRFYLFSLLSEIFRKLSL